MKYVSYLLVIFYFVSRCCMAEEATVTYVKSEAIDDDRNAYFVQLLRLIIEKTEHSTNKVVLKETQDTMQQGRALKELEADRSVDIVWSVTSNEREDKLLPIRVPLLKGLLGYRVFIIRKQEQSQFSSIDTIEQLKQLTAGQGHDWPDTQILKANGIDVVTSPTYIGLFNMLKSKRFDYFPRGINEIWLEMDPIATNNLAIEEHLLFYYPSPIYFFVNKKNETLARRIQEGLQLALKDGSFDKLFYTNKAHQRALELVKSNQRTIFKLDNPLLSPLTPLNKSNLWFTPEQLIQE